MSSNSTAALAKRAASHSGRKGQAPIPERLLHQLWQQRAARQRWFRTDQGVRVRVLYPGRPGNTAGPDFRDALLDVDGVGLVRGDVEIHRHQRDWDAHGHSNDPHYNSVVMHAALELGPSVTTLPNGQPTPVISLAPLLQDQRGTDTAPPSLWDLLAGLGYARPKTAQETGQLLDRAGDARFHSKSARFGKFLSEQDPRQAFHEAILEAMGYRHNQQPFVTLASRAPYQVLARLSGAIAPEQRAAAIESWLLQLSGLVVTDVNSGMGLPGGGFGPPMSGQEWQCFRLRPANHPRSRIAGAARLLSRYMEPGLLSGLQALAEQGQARKLVAGLEVPNDVPGGTALIGTGRARDLAVNVVSPFLHALASVRERRDQSAQYLELYGNFAKLQENEVTREMAHQLISPAWGKVVNSARRQQGLIHLQRLLSGASG